MGISTYNALVSAIIETVEEDASEELISYVQNFAVDLAELRVTRDIDGIGFVRYEYTNLTPTDPFLTKPAGLLFMKHLRMEDGGAATFLDLRTDEFLQDYWPDRTSIGTPKYYANFGAETLVLAPAPTSANYVELCYVGRVSALASSQQSNWILETLPDALYYAAMVQVCRFMKNPSEAERWEMLYQQARASYNNFERKLRRDDRESMDSPQRENDVNA